MNFGIKIFLFLTFFENAFLVSQAVGIQYGCLPKVVDLVQSGPSKAEVFYANHIDQIEELAAKYKDKNPVFLSILKKGHYELHVGPYKLDAGVAQKPILQDGSIHASSVLFYFPHISEEKKSEWIKKMIIKHSEDSKGNFKRISCVQTACYGLKELGVHNKPFTNTIFLVPTYKNGIEKGFFDAQGNPVDFKILITDETWLNHKENIARLRILSLRHTIFYGGIAGIVSLVSTGASGVVGLVIYRAFQDDDDSKPSKNARVEFIEGDEAIRELENIPKDSLKLFE